MLQQTDTIYKEINNSVFCIQFRIEGMNDLEYAVAVSQILNFTSCNNS